jgi:hypothetical protein
MVDRGGFDHFFSFSSYFGRSFSCYFRRRLAAGPFGSGGLGSDGRSWCHHAAG